MLIFYMHHRKVCSIVAGVTPSAIHVGSIVQGIRLASAQGRDFSAVDDETDASRKVSCSVVLCV